MSASPASSRCAAIRVAFFFTRRAASSTEPLARLPGAELAVTRALQGGLEAVGVAPAVELPAPRAPVGKGGRGDEVAAADLGGIETEAAGRHVHQTLHHEGGLLLAERAVRA